MKNHLRHWAAILAGAAALGFSSCTYDPYYSAAGGSYYGSSYGYGQGYGGSNFSTSLFVTTGDPRWGYDPHCYSYYDYRSRRYYDPYLNGYYPVGYRPPVVVGAPHPYGWRPGRSYCPPPRSVRNVTVPNYHNRANAYRNSNYAWARQVRQQPPPRNHPQTYRRNPNPYQAAPYSAPQTQDNRWFSRQGSQAPDHYSRQRGNPGSRYPQQAPQSRGRNARLPESYNTPAAAPFQPQRNTNARRAARPDQRQAAIQTQQRAAQRQAIQARQQQAIRQAQRNAAAQPASRPAPPPANRGQNRPFPPNRDSRGGNPRQKPAPGEEPQPGIRSLGQG